MLHHLAKALRDVARMSPVEVTIFIAEVVVAVALLAG
jgi:hypothetical protein